MPAKKSQSDFNFEKSIETLNNIVEQMEKGELSLEQSLAHFEKGINIIHDCQKALTQAEQKIEILTQQTGKDALKSYETDE